MPETATAVRAEQGGPTSRLGHVPYPVFQPQSQDGTSWITRIRRAGWDEPGGENIARGYSRAGTVVPAWMNSPGHRRNILNCKFRNLGVGYAQSGHYWVQDFGY